MKLIIFLSWAASVLAFPAANPFPMPFPQRGADLGGDPPHSHGDTSSGNQAGISTGGGNNGGGGYNGRANHNQGRGGKSSD
ncbi:hypothetical protein EG328_011970 [Venturia inaequalis]|uniref:Uncharacterized protein n=1 Tax=Venturia inaequalis TaxID=5025 RepID=A0A8H3YLQ3_VENIN|nr:hypothetical protein EG328_011970 [Venturia inaequalis]KAE9968200.1 hypothetical protein EG327_011138 [Venturia inaequalis]